MIQTPEEILISAKVPLLSHYNRSCVILFFLFSPLYSLVFQSLWETCQNDGYMQHIWKCTQQHKANLLFSKSVSGTFLKHTFTVMRLHGKCFILAFYKQPHMTVIRNLEQVEMFHITGILFSLSIIQTLYTDTFVFSYEHRCEVASSFSFPLHSALVESIESTFLCSDLFGS